MSIQRLPLAVAALALPVLMGPAMAQRPPPPAAVSRSAEAVSVIEAVDQRERSVILRSEDGTLTTLFLGKHVRNLPQVKAGDRVVTRVTQAVAVAMTPADAPGTPPVAGEGAAVAPPGSLPGATYVRSLRLPVTVNAVDRSSNSVTVTGPQGQAQTVTLHDQKMRDFARRLRPGDRVQVTIVEGISIDVVP
ncbi:hypothetical protein [Roseicella sp. DB1501]|uniref:hypothetical protein n=1 Tax=Roseicella sp. DB1501 TaxID=2730925 RepID=UPI001491B404|nr:hypothetical protein [Roseicella sp. DB1501]NOG71666.1 hypothetical protein [Roseicella sp. DB1501]